MENLRKESTHETSLHRIGAVSKLSGVPVSTLRIWEQRYGAFEPAKTAGQHRLYGEGDVARARLMRQLTEAGHGISSVARLGVEALEALRQDASREAWPAAARPVRVVLVGGALAARIGSAAWQQRFFGAPLEIVATHADLAALLAAPAPQGGADLLLARMGTLQEGLPALLGQALARAGAARAVVLYNFATNAMVAQVRAQGIELRREPVPDSELADLVRAGFAGQPDLPGPMGAVPPRRYSDEALVEVAARPSPILCECPRHIADLVAQLAGFEQYSEKCLSETAQDAEVHAYLKSVSGTCRAMMEVALDKVLAHAAQVSG